jgi:hypothetical protein
MLFLLLPVLAFANTDCPNLTGKYLCDGKVPGFWKVEVASETYEEGKQKIAVLLHWENGGSRRDEYLPDDPGLKGKFPNGGSFKIVDHCAGQTLIHENINSGVLPNGKLRGVLETESFSLQDGNLSVSMRHDEYLDSEIVRTHKNAGVCRPVTASERK